MSIDQNLIQIDKDLNWNDLIICDRTFRYIINNKLQIKVYEAY